jgi:hypothetical protein
MAALEKLFRRSAGRLGGRDRDALDEELQRQLMRLSLDGAAMDEPRLSDLHEAFPGGRRAAQTDLHENFADEGIDDLSRAIRRLRARDRW